LDTLAFVEYKANLIIKIQNGGIVIENVKPLNILNSSMNQRVIVELRSSREYRGTLDGYDPHMNLVLRNVEELQEGKLLRKLNIAIVRGDNVIYISP